MSRTAGGIDASPLIKILVVEDDELDFKLLRATLEKSPAVSIVRVEDGDKAFKFITGIPPYSDRSRYPLPDVVLLDLGLPKSSGFELLERVRRLKEEVGCTIYVLSGRDTPEARARAAQLGAQGYFLKPLSLGHLAEIVANFSPKKSEPVIEKLSPIAQER